MPTLAGKEVGKGHQAVGYGLMGLTWRKNPVTYEEAFRAMRAALDTGSNFWNGGELYGPPTANSLQLLNAYFTKYPQDAEKVVLSIKGGINAETHRPDGSAENVRRSVDNCLKLLDGKKSLDLFECARVDPNTPIEVTITTLAEYVKSGKLGGICLSECGPDTIRRAAAIHKIEGVEIEFSLFATDILNNGVAQVCAELDIPVIAYSPLSRGFLTGQITKLDDIPEDDMRRGLPRFHPGNFEKNLELAREVEQIARRKGCTIGQVALGWIVAQSGRDGLPTIIPIPGSTTEARAVENNKLVTLSDAELEELDRFVKGAEVAGGRYGGPLAALEFGETKAL